MQYCIFSRRGRRVTQSFDYADERGGSRNAVRMEHTSEAKYVSAQSVLVNNIAVDPRFLTDPLRN